MGPETKLQQREARGTAQAHEVPITALPEGKNTRNNRGHRAQNAAFTQNVRI